MSGFKYLAVLLLVVFGFFIAVISLYQSSISGVYLKMGFDSSNYSNEVDLSGYDEVYMDLSDKYGRCEHLDNIYKSLSLRYGKANTYQNYLDMGNDEFSCGVMMVANGSVKRGVFTIIKGQRYLIRSSEECGNVDECGQVKNSLEEMGKQISNLSKFSDGRVRDILNSLIHEIEISSSSISN